jgi:TctA family transporter
MVMLASIFYGAMYGGSTTSILLNIPGEAASVVTCLDGHQMAKQGRQTVCASTCVGAIRNLPMIATCRFRMSCQSFGK